MTGIRAKQALISVGPLTFAAVTALKGDGGANTQITQDFKGNPYLTLFGSKVSVLHLVCTDLTLVNCRGEAGGMTTVKAIKTLHNSIERGQLERIRVSNNGEVLMNGFLIGVSFETKLPVASYVLSVIGTLGK